MPAPNLPKDFLRTSLLLLLREDPAHGYELIERAAVLGFERNDPGGLYRTLRKLEQDGFVRSAWEESKVGPPRRIYSITRAGSQELHRRMAAVAEGTGIVAALLARYEEFVTMRRAGRGAERAHSR